jgi:SAM-dependent methyltransferase
MVICCAERAYATLAPYYDNFTRHHQHDVWLERLEALARTHGLSGRRVLDVGCGTGKSLLPLVRRGYDGAGCDVSPDMLSRARSALPEVPLHRADMRALPRSIGVFDWITCLDDALNYLLDEDDLARALSSMARLLCAGGLLTFDLNSLKAHREGFAATWVVEEPGLFLCWEGRGCAPEPGEPGSADISIFERADSAWLRHASRHEQRWWGTDDVRRACGAAGLVLVAVHGQLPGARLQPDVDESTHTKLVYLARRSSADHHAGRRHRMIRDP